MVSMKDIAKKANVSIATVSKALNGYSDIGQKKREEIQRIAREMGYFPNSSARALKTNRTWNLGILFSDNMKSGLTHDYFAAIIDSFKVTAESRGYDLTFTSMSMVANRKMTYYEHCRYRGLDGVVIANMDFSQPEVIELIRSSLPVVTIDFVFDGRTAIVSDNMRGMAVLTEHICSLGHTKIAYIHGDQNSVTRERLASFYRTLAEHKISIPESYVKASRYRDIDTTEKMTEELLSLTERPTCILFPDDYAALGGIRTIRRKGLRIPEDISVAGYDGIVMSRILNPELTTMRQNTALIGSKAADELISLIENPKTFIVQRILVDPALQEGGTVLDLRMPQG